MYFYELHEGDEDIFSDVLLVRDDEMDPEDFFELVQSIRRRIQDTYEDDTLIEAIAVELEREHGFVFVSDEKLSAAVNVSSEEAENFLAEIDRGDRDDDEDEDEDEDENEDEDDEDLGGAGFRSIVADFDPSGGSGRPN